MQLPPFQPAPFQPPSKAERELREQELRRDFTKPIPVFYRVIWIVLLLSLIVGILGATVFHFW